MEHSGVYYKSRSFSNSIYIHSVVLPEEIDFQSVIVKSEIIGSTDYEYQSRSVRDLTKRYLSIFYSDDVIFGKNERGIPSAHLDGSPTGIDISFSHDGNVVGFALMM